MRSGVVGSLQVLICWMACSLTAWAQTADQGQVTSPSYTLHIGTRLVLTDVTVTDKQGNPVKGLKDTSFQIFDNGKPQQLASFAEHTSADIPPAPAHLSSGVFSNSYLHQPPPAFNVLLLDITTIRIVDQMYLAQQLQKFVAAIPPNGLLAVYTRAGDSVVLLQDFTSDHTLLLAAVKKAIPHLQQPGSWAASDLDTLWQMMTLLRPYPGRKNLIWFGGGSNLALLADPLQVPAYVDMRPIYDALESTRIAVYPVDARGLTVTSYGGMVWQHMMMEDAAHATGGQAFYNNNGLQQIAAHVIDTGSDFYTLTYDPHEQNFDNKWHNVKVTVQADGKSYQLSYRRGYYDDGSNASPAAGQRTALRANGTTHQLPPDILKAPILFSATVLPAVGPPAGTPTPLHDATAAPSPKKNETAYNIHFTFPAADLVEVKDGKPVVTVGTGVLAVNRLGTRVAKEVESVQVSLDPDKLRDHPKGLIAFDEQINLPKGQDFLYIMLWDRDTGRFGAVQAPVDVSKRAD